jgi:hypothetical protein
MYNKSVVPNCDIINRYMQVFDNKNECYKFFNAMFPKVAVRRIEYIKKAKTEDEPVEYKLLAKKNELSMREIKNYIDLLKS